jgi:peptidoglycan/xylan/chitin deacetylase (PgdA/CDA1 family)
MSISSFARRGAKVAVLPAGAWTRRRSGDFVALLYHRIGVGDREIDVPTAAFEAQVASLVERDRILSLDQALSSEAPDGVVLTFDDGFRDFSDTVVPCLARHRAPAVLYLATGLVANGRGATDESLTWSQLEEAVSTGLVTVGSHTHDHMDLSRVDEATAEEQMRKSKGLIEDRLQVECRHFAYPWAVASPPADRVARRLFHTAALDAWRTNRRRRLDLHRLGRTPVLRNDRGALFRAKSRGLLDGEALLYRALGRGPWRRA